MTPDDALQALKPRLNTAAAESSFLACQEAQAAGAAEEDVAAILKAYASAWGILEAVIDGKDPEPVRAALRAGKAPSEADWPE